MKNIILIALSLLLSNSLYAETYDQYAPYKQSYFAKYYSFKENNFLCSDVYSHPHERSDCISLQGAWISKPLENNKIDIAWPTIIEDDDGNRSIDLTLLDANIEEHEIKENCNGGHSYVWLNAYRNDVVGQRYRIETTSATYTDLTTGAVYPITDGGSCGQQGQPYALYPIYGPYKVQVWGDIYPHNGTTPDRRFFWDHTITPNQTAKNKFWVGPGSRTKEVIVQQESWWDSLPCGERLGTTDSLGIGCWALGSGPMDTTTNEPNGLNVIYGRKQTIAKDTGYAWTLTKYDEMGDVEKKMGIRELILLGDANGDNVVEIADVIQVINLVLSGSIDIPHGADCHIDETMTIRDVICTINSVLTSPN